MLKCYNKISLFLAVILLMGFDCYGDNRTILIGKWVPVGVMNAVAHVDSFKELHFLNDGTLLKENHLYAKWHIIEDGRIELLTKDELIYFANIHQGSLMVNMFDEKTITYGIIPIVVYKKKE